MRATSWPSALHMTHFTGGLFSSAMVFLKVIKGNRGHGNQNEACSTTIEYHICLDGWFDGFHDRVWQIPDLNQLTSENGQHRTEEGRSNLLGWLSVVQQAYSLWQKWRCEQTLSSINGGIHNITICLSGKHRQLVQAIVQRDCEDNSVLCRIVAQCPQGYYYIWATKFADTDKAKVWSGREVIIEPHIILLIPNIK